MPLNLSVPGDFEPQMEGDGAADHLAGHRRGHEQGDAGIVIGGRTLSLLLRSITVVVH